MDNGILTAMAERLRARRSEMGLTQAELAREAGVSPRFLVQLEKGEGNISVGRLAEVCAALELPLEHLFRGLGPGTPDKLALVGLRGAGKSTIGAALARHLDVPFIELDALVEDRAGMSLSEIFQLRGEAYYRQVEARVLERVLSEPGPAVLATGGSIVTSPDSWRRLQESARTVWLRASPAAHLQRVQAQGDLRPMAGRPDALAEIGEILEERSPLYAQASLQIDTEVMSVERAVQVLA